ncbi:MAG: wax ester/triacylglycerol synthase family O-acyltransferase [Beijerinckiaceae bacterium]
MDHLSTLDASFLHLETPETPMHVASLLLLELPDNYQGSFYEDVKNLLANRIHLARVLHRKLASMPFELGDPVWIEDNDIDIDYHVRHVRLPEPGTMEQLEAFTARLHSSALDRSRPLWEVYVIDGLESGQVGYYNKVHHSGIDGKAGAELANVLYDVTPQPRVFDAPVRPRSGGYQLGVTEMFEAGIRNAVTQYTKLAKILPKAAEVMRDLAGAAMRLPSRSEASQALKPAPKTLFNVAITNQRSFAGMRVPLVAMKAVAKRHGATLNDIVMAVCAGGLRRFLDTRNALPEEPLSAAMPASLREPGDKSMNNQVTMMRVNLATDIADPQKRLDAIRGSSEDSKEMLSRIKGIITTDLPMMGSPWIMSGFAMLYGRSNLADRVPALANVAISNVPGPPQTLYVAGAKMVSYYPLSIPYHGMALNITVQSYAGSMDFGLTACRRAMPQTELYALVKDMQAAYAELETLPGSELAGAQAAAAANRAPAAGAASAAPH